MSSLKHDYISDTQYAELIYFLAAIISKRFGPLGEGMHISPWGPTKRIGDHNHFRIPEKERE